MCPASLPRGTGAPPYHFRCRTITVAYFGAGGGTLEYPEGMGAEARALVDARTPAEYRNVAEDAQRMGRAGKLAFAPRDFADDVRKQLAVVLRHAEREFGTTDPGAYLAVARDVAGAANHVFVRAYKGEVQLVLGSDEHQAYVVVDMTLQLRGAYGHAMKPGGWKQCLRNNLERQFPRLK